MVARQARRLLGAGLTGAGFGALGMLFMASRSRKPDPECGPVDPPPGLPPAYAVPVPGHGEIFLRDTGERGGHAPTLLLLHGWMFPADLNWFPSYGELGRIGRVLAPDHRGHGRGTRPSEPYRLVDVADDCAALLQHLDAGPAVLVGFSMGGPVAQLLWQRHPELVSGMVLAGTSATFSLTPRDRWQWRGMGVLQVLLRLLPRAWYERAARAQAHGQMPQLVSRMIHTGTPPDVVARLSWLVGELARGSAEDVAEAGRELGRYDARGWIASVDVPTAVVVTERDRLVPADRQRDMAARIPGARCWELPLDHDGPVAGAEVFVPTLVEAVHHVLAGGAQRRDAPAGRAVS